MARALNVNPDLGYPARLFSEFCRENLHTTLAGNINNAWYSNQNTNDSYITGQIGGNFQFGRYYVYDTSLNAGLVELSARG